MERVMVAAVQVWRDRERLRDLVIDANDGIVAIAGVVEGVLAAGLGNRAAATAVVMATIAGGISLGGSRYAEEAAEQDARVALIDEERRRLGRSPEDELDELTALYEEKCPPPELARVVANELTAADALAAHAEEEHGIEIDEPRPSPLVARDRVRTRVRARRRRRRRDGGADAVDMAGSDDVRRGHHRAGVELAGRLPLGRRAARSHDGAQCESGSPRWRFRS